MTTAPLGSAAMVGGALPTQMLKLHVAALAAVGSTIFLASNEAKAIVYTGTQDSGVQAFSTIQSGVAKAPLSSPTPLINYAGFDPTAVPSARKNVTLTGYEFYLTNVTLGGAMYIYNNSSTVPIPANTPLPVKATTFFQVLFDTMYQPDSGKNGVVQATYEIPVTIPPSLSGPGQVGSGVGAITGGPFNSVTPTLAIKTPPASAGYTKPNTVSIQSYYSTWEAGSSTYNFDIGPNASSTYKPLVNGNVGVRYVYSYTIDETPSPLPILGASAAFGFTRKLRRAIKAST